MKSVRLKRLLCCLMILPQLYLTGCWSAREVNDLAISVAIGIDRAKEGYLVTEQVINPKAIASQKAAAQEDPVIIFTAEAPNLESAIKKLYGQSSRMFFNAHLRVVAISEEVAEEGIGDFIDFFYRSHEYRTDFYFVVAKEVSAKELLSVLTPLESVPAVALSELLKLADHEWAPVEAMKVTELVNCIVRQGIDPVLPIIEILPYQSGTSGSSEERKNKNLFRFAGLAVMNGDHMIGQFNEDESKGYNYIRGGITHTNGSAGDGGTMITYDIINTHSEIVPTMENGQPSIQVNIGLEYRIEAIQGDIDVTKIENREKISGFAASRIEELCMIAVTKAQNEYRTDVFGFGEKIHNKYPKYWKTVEGNWEEVFSKLPVQVTVQAHIKTSGEINKVIP